LLAFHPRRIAVSAIAPARADSARRPLNKYRLADKSTVARRTRGGFQLARSFCRGTFTPTSPPIDETSRRSFQASYRGHREQLALGAAYRARACARVRGTAGGETARQFRRGHSAGYLGADV